MDNKFILAQQLFNTFFFNKKAYAIQENINNEINFITKHERIDVNKLFYYLENKTAVLSYQQVFDKLMWICLDFDIKKNFLDNASNPYNFVTDNNYRPMLLEDVNIAIQYLTDNNIRYTLEYSGNRGIHIWIFFDYAVTKQIGFSILNHIYTSIPFKYAHNIDSPIGIDLFPKVPEAKNNKLGKGVKIPLSYHLKSNRYSYLLEDIATTEISEISELDETFINNQINLVKNIKRNSVSNLIDLLEITEVNKLKLFERQYGNFTEKISLDSILLMLNRCIYFQRILSKSIDFWSEEERKIMVATLVRIKSESDSRYGIKLLKELFSKASNYDEEKTNSKIERLKNLYPPTIEYLKHLFNIDCEYCIKNNISNTLQLLDGIEITTQDDWDNIIKWAINSEKNYLHQNDDVPLNYIHTELNKLSLNSLRDELNTILHGKITPSPQYNKYLRIESSEKNRTLYGMNAKDRVITTVLMKYIYDLIGTDIISPISYSYRINTELTNDIFVNWNQLWLDFVKEVQDCVNHEGYQNHYMIRLDIKSFYDEINLTLLQEILHSKAKSNINNIYIKMVFNQLDATTKTKYVNACNYLIDTCKTFGKKGVPQGPAFARFLAEIYLSSLDNYILNSLDDKCDFVCRYVDDYYIFIKDNIKGEEIKNSISEQLEKIYLNINTDKFKFGTVSSLKDSILEKNQFEKYFIDGISEGTPINVINNALVLLNNMFLSMGTTDDVKDLPFFLTHLVDEKYKKSKAPYIIKKITSSNIGRGSMFKHFYKNIAFEYSDLSFYSSIEGLSRSNFINQLQEHISCIDHDKLIEIVKYYTTINLCTYEKIELLRLIFFTGLDIDISIFMNNDYRIVFDVLYSIESTKWTNSNLNKIIDKIGNLENKNESINLISHILCISQNMPLNCEINSLIYSLLSLNYCEISIDNIQTMFNLICYFTLYDNSNSRISELWNNFFIKLYSEKTYNLDSKGWYKYDEVISHNSISDKNILFVLNLVLSGLSIKNDNQIAEPLETEFSLYLIQFLYDGTAFSKTITNDIQSLIKEKAKSEKNELLLWLCDGAEYLIDRKIALKNIQLNDRMVLKNGTKLLVRGDKKIFSTSDNIIQDKWGTYIFDKFYTIYTIDDTLCDFKNKVKEKTSIDALILCKNLITQMKKDGLVNIFEKGSLSESNNNIKYTYSKLDNKFIINQSENINNNEQELFFKMFDSLVEYNLKPYKLNFGLDIIIESNFKNIIPQHKIFRKTSNNLFKERIIFYLLEFTQIFENYLSNNTKINLYQMEEIKIQSILSIIKKYRKEIPSYYDNWKESLIALDIYNGFYGKDFENYILYKKVNVSFDNLDELITIINSSISGNFNFSFIDDLQLLFHGTLNKLQENFPQTKNFLVANVSFNTISETVEINNTVYAFKDIKCIKLFENNELLTLNDELAFYMERNQLIFFFNNILLTVPVLFSKTLEILRYKKGDYDINMFRDTLSISNLSNFEVACEKIQKQNVSMSIDKARFQLYSFLNGVDSSYHQSIINVISNYKIMEESEIDTFVDNIKKCLDTGNIYTLPLKDYIKDRNGLFMILEKDEKISKIFGRNESYGKKLENRIRSFSLDNEIYNDIAFISDIGLSGKQIKNVIDSYESNKITEKNYKYTFELLKKKVTNAQNIIFINCIYTPFYKKNIIALFEEKFNINSSKITFVGTELTDYKKYHLSNLDIITRNKFIEFVYKYFDSTLNRRIKGQKIKYSEYLELCNSNNLNEEDAVQTLLIARKESLPKCHQLVFENSIFRYRED